MWLPFWESFSGDKGEAGGPGLWRSGDSCSGQGDGVQVVVCGWILRRFGSEGQQDSRLDVGEEEE